MTRGILTKCQDGQKDGSVHSLGTEQMVERLIRVKGLGEGP